MTMEIIGEETDNRIYRDIEKLLKKDINKRTIDKCIEEENPVVMFISVLISCLVREIHSDEEIHGFEGSGRLNSLINDMYARYLKTPTNKFFRKMGYPTINSLSEYGFLTINKYEGKQ